MKLAEYGSTLPLILCMTIKNFTYIDFLLTVVSADEMAP